jgi:hypothetical protein
MCLRTKDDAPMREQVTATPVTQLNMVSEDILLEDAVLPCGVDCSLRDVDTTCADSILPPYFAHNFLIFLNVALLLCFQRLTTGCFGHQPEHLPPALGLLACAGYGCAVDGETPPGGWYPGDRCSLTGMPPGSTISKPSWKPRRVVYTL